VTVPPQACLYTIAYLPRERIEALLLDEIRPIVREIRAHPDLDSLFFVRYSEPRWQLRFRVFGRPAWVQGALRERLEELVARLQAGRVIEGHAFARYEREIERYGGEEGMALAERLFYLDSLAALDLCDAERRGVMAKSRREVALLFADRLADLAGFDESQRLAYYRRGFSWALETGEWTSGELEVLERKFLALRPGLERLFATGGDEASRWGGEEVAEIVQRFAAAAAPVLREIVDGHAAGRIRQDLVYLLWSYAHMFTNRLGIESTPEAILRFFMHRYLQERRPVAA
jgi:thiopeptide-type bacteriocin biosynthesis protein